MEGKIQEAFANPLTSLPEDIDGDLRFFGFYPPYDPFGESIVRSIQDLEKVPKEYGFDIRGYKGVGDIPPVEIKKVFALAVSGQLVDKPIAEPAHNSYAQPTDGVKRTLMAADVSLNAYHATMKGYENEWKGQKMVPNFASTVDGFLSQPTFQVICALHGFVRVETNTGKVILPQINTVPVLSKQRGPAQQSLDLAMPK